MEWVIGIYMMIAFLAGQTFQPSKASVHFDRMTQLELLFLGMGWPLMAMLAIYCWWLYYERMRAMKTKCSNCGQESNNQTEGNGCPIW